MSDAGRVKDRAAERRQLARLDDRMLRDIGIDTASAQYEAPKRFWQGRFEDATGSAAEHSHQPVPETELVGLGGLGSPGHWAAGRLERQARQRPNADRRGHRS